MNKAYKYMLRVGNPLIAGLLFLAFCVLVTGCSLTPSEYTAYNPGKPSRALVDNVPFFPQDVLQCGPASLAMVLNWSGVSVDPSELSPNVYTPGLKGSLQNSMIGATRRHGRVAYPLYGVESLMAELSAGHPVIVLVNLGFPWYPKWHYAVVIGYDQNEEVMILHSGLIAEETISFRTFNNIWKRADDWGLLVLQPQQLPVTAKEDKWLNAIAGLENAEQWQAATIGYKTALKRWENSFVSWMGLGNSNYNLGDLDASADAFYQATLLQPENGMAHNNLAHVMAKQGKLKKALAAAKLAAGLGGEFQPIFHQTLEEIKEMKLNKE